MNNFTLGHAIFLALAFCLCLFGGAFIAIASVIFNLPIGFYLMGWLSMISSFLLFNTVR